MSSSHFTILFDSNVLYSIRITSLIMRLAVADVFRAKWTEEIHQEWMSHLKANRPHLTDEQIHRRKEMMNKNAREPLVIGHMDLIDSITTPDPDDRHVIAAAIRCHANLIVTFNIKDFPEDSIKQYQIEIQHPDEFLCYQFDLAENVFLKAVKTDRMTLKKPPFTVDQYIESLITCGVPRIAEKLQEFSDLL